MKIKQQEVTGQSHNRKIETFVRIKIPLFTGGLGSSEDFSSPEQIIIDYFQKE